MFSSIIQRPVIEVARFYGWVIEATWHVGYAD